MSMNDQPEAPPIREMFAGARMLYRRIHSASQGSADPAALERDVGALDELVLALGRRLVAAPDLDMDEARRERLCSHVGHALIRDLHADLIREPGSEGPPGQP